MMITISRNLQLCNGTTLNVWSRGKQFCFPESPDVSRDGVKGNIRTRGKSKLTSFPRNHTLSA